MITSARQPRALRSLVRPHRSVPDSTAVSALTVATTMTTTTTMTTRMRMRMRTRKSGTAE